MEKIFLTKTTYDFLKEHGFNEITTALRDKGALFDREASLWYITEAQNINDFKYFILEEPPKPSPTEPVQEEAQEPAQEISTPKVRKKEENIQVVGVRFKKTEHEKLKEKAKNLNITISDLIRQALTKKDFKPKKKTDPTPILEIVKHCNRVSSNINQIAKALHIANLKGEEISKLDLLNELLEIESSINDYKKEAFKALKKGL